MKKIEVCELPVSDLKFNFGNPRKIGKKKKEELKESLENMGDFGSFVVDEDLNVIAGNQRARILQEYHPEQIVLCKKLIGYSVSEKRAINIKDNVHSGDWDVDILADWTADLNIDLDLGGATDLAEKKIPKMEAIHFEKYDYVLVVCRNELDYSQLLRKLNLEGQKVYINEKKKIKSRAVWYDDICNQIVAKEDLK